MSTATLPGIVFETVPPPVTDPLPRMDVVGLAGIAARGPIDLPVLVEDPATFRDVFGPDVELARADDGTAVWSHLGRAVEAFFANGGRRAWVVRVARTGDGGAQTGCFLVPGLLAPAAGSGRPAEPDGWRLATLAARSPGAWSDRMSAGVVLEAAVSLAVEVRAGEVVLEPACDVVVGDLLRLVIDPDTVLLAEVAAVRPDQRGKAVALEQGTARLVRRQPPPATATMWLLSAGPPRGVPGYRCEPSANGFLVTVETPEAGQVGGEGAGRGVGAADVGEGAVLAAQVGSSLLLVTLGEEQQADPGHNRRFAVVDSCRVGAAAPAWRDLAGGAVLVEIQRARLIVRDGDAVVAELSGLGLGAAHPRRLGSLPSDDRLFTALGLRSADSSADEPVSALLTALDRECLAPRFPLAGAGLPGPLLPLRLATDPAAIRFGGPVVQSAAAAQARDGLATFGADLFVDPALAGLGVDTLLPTALDLLHVRTPARRLRGIHALLILDDVTLVAAPDAAHSGWVSQRTSALPSLSPPHLRVIEVDGSGLHLTWTPVATATGYRLEVDLRDAFPDPLGSVTTATAAVVPPRTDCPAAHFLRVRALRGWEDGPASNVVLAMAPATQFSPCVLPVPEHPDPEPTAARTPDTLAWRARSAADAAPWATLLAVHTALLRCCAARGDLLAILGLPQSARTADVVRHLALLRGARPAFDGSGLPAPGVFLDGGVPGLTDDEAPVLGYGALYHPWLVGGQPGVGLRAEPPDGAVAGTYAARALTRGAWIAPARQVLTGTLALAPDLDPAGLPVLVSAGVNPVVEEPDGFVVITAATASEVTALRPVNVRRLIALLRRLAVREGARIVFEPHDRDLQRVVRMRFERFLTELFLRGAFAGATPQEAFEVSTGDAVNPPAGIDAGRFVVEVRIAPSRALEFVTVRLVLAGADTTRGAT